MKVVKFLSSPKKKRMKIEVNKIMNPVFYDLSINEIIFCIIN